jgi:hypothetical protein
LNETEKETKTKVDTIPPQINNITRSLVVNVGNTATINASF